MATAVSRINNANRDKLYNQLMEVARKRTAQADVQMDDRGRAIDEDTEEFGENVLIVENAATTAPSIAS